MDVYISSKCNLFIRDIEKHLKYYDTASACRAAVDFVDVLNNWYISQLINNNYYPEKTSLSTLAQKTQK